MFSTTVTSMLSASPTPGILVAICVGATLDLKAMELFVYEEVSRNL